MATNTTVHTKPRTKPIAAIVMCIALILTLVGGYAASIVHTSHGTVKIHDIQYVTEDGGLMRALLYVPVTATPDAPAPAVISCHGYNNTAEVQDLNCVELSKRGFVVMAIDAYGHGLSELPDPNINGGIVADMGTYSALQYMSTLPYVDLDRIGMTGHSMGSAAIQDGALRAFQAHESDPSIVVPAAILPTANSFSVDADGNAYFDDYPVNLGAVYGQFDEWAIGMWGTLKGSDINTTPKAIAGMGFSGAQYGSYYTYGDAAPIDRTAAAEAAAAKSLRVIYQPPHDHPMMHFNGQAVGGVVDFFDLTLTGGQGALPASSQTWFGKQLGTGLSLVSFFVFITALGLTLLKTRFFGTIVRPEPDGLTAVTDAPSRIRYWVIYIIGLLPAPLIYNWAVGYSIDITAQGRTVPITLPANGILPMPCVNGVFLLNILTGIIALAIYLLVFFTISRKLGCTMENMGIRIPGREIAKAALLAICVFAAGYFLLVLCGDFFQTDFRFFTLSIKPLTAAKWPIYLRYLPSFLFFFLVSAMSLNTFTRINGKREWINMLLIVFASFGGLLVLHLIDYISLKHTGVKVFQTIPGQGTTAALAGVLLWGLLFILPVAAAITRIFFKKTGSIWVGGFINALIVTLFAISNTVIAGYVY